MGEWQKKLHWWVILALIAGTGAGIVLVHFGGEKFAFRWISPWGIIFLNLLKLLAIPLIFTSLIVGVATLADLKSLGRLGTRTVLLYLGTTAIAVSLGVVLASALQPGQHFPSEFRAELETAYAAQAEARADAARNTAQRGPLNFVVDLFPDNLLRAASNNANTLQVVVLSLLIGIAFVMVGKDKAAPAVNVLDSFKEMLIALVNLVICAAPFAVFALIVDSIVTVAQGDTERIGGILSALASYMATLLLGMILHAVLIYGFLVKYVAGISLRYFLKGIARAQLLAFSTSSSAATMPVTMQQCQEKLKVPPPIASFVIPLGTTINMDGTAMYQAVAVIFIAQVVGVDLSMGDQLTIVFTAVLASIGTAAVPGVGIIMVLVILQMFGIPEVALGLILGVDRLLDMCRTTLNVTGDAVVAVVNASRENPTLYEHSTHRDVQ